MVLQADVLVDSSLACSIYDSCRSVAIVGETTAMQSGLVRHVLEESGVLDVLGAACPLQIVLMSLPCP